MSDAGKPSYTSLGLAVGADWSVTCHTYLDQPPILSIDAGSAHLTITAAGQIADAGHVDFAYALLSAVDKYLTACETYRLDAQEAANTPPADDAAGPHAA